ncbi:hypothetical protein TIFTF001_052015 [Ficus carica]|uniref:Uncharacterized protein n=1 Tax=Ficus carica TaxID=3494 RepID=A0AA88JD84_FICCA|nr:hypothetical protein TIFTF001_052015 [Ficus carica]
MYIYSATRIDCDVGLEEIAATPDWARGRTVRGRVTVGGRISPNRSCSGHEPTPIVTVRRVDRGPAFRPRTLQTEIRAVRGRSKLAKGEIRRRNRSPAIGLCVWMELAIGAS